jgi:hypothetical protein
MSAAGADETRISGFVNDANTGIAIMLDGRVATAMRIGGTARVVVVEHPAVPDAGKW